MGTFPKVSKAKHTRATVYRVIRYDQCIRGPHYRASGVRFGAAAPIKVQQQLAAALSRDKKVMPLISLLLCVALLSPQPRLLPNISHKYVGMSSVLQTGQPFALAS